MNHRQPISCILLFASACGGTEANLEGITRDPIRNGVELPGLPSAFDSVGILQDRARGYVCSGILIKPSVVLTAAHCLYGAQPQDIWFTNHIPLVYADPWNAPDAWVGGTSIEVHPTYVPGVIGVGVDLAYLTLEERFAGVTYQAIDTGVPASGSMEIVGWGIDETNSMYGAKRRGNVTVTGREAIYLDYSGAVQPNALITSVAGAADQMICPGDSGGPSFRVVSGTRYLTGIASFIGLTDQNAPCTSAVEGFHVAAGTFRTWIVAMRDTLWPAGRCAGDDDAEFATLNGGCFAKNVGITFSHRTATALSRTGAINACANLSEGGHSDWRLPISSELTAAAAVGAAGQLTSAGASRFWTSDYVNATQGRAVRLTDGAVTLHTNATTLYVFCVR